MRRRGDHRRASEEGYALVAAVASIAVFSAMALTLLSATRLQVQDASSELRELQAAAAADAGVVMAINQLAAENAAQRWSIGQGERTFRYGDARISVRVEDERGKIPISRVDEKLATRLLEEVGLSGDHLLIARDSLLDWLDGDSMTRPFGAEAAYYQASGIRPPNDWLATVDELRSVRGFDPKVVERLRPLVTTYTAMSSFDSRYASKTALEIIHDAGGEGSPISTDHGWGVSGMKTAIEFTDSTSLIGRPLTITIDASVPDNGHASRRFVIELTGHDRRPYLVRAAD